MFITTIEFVTSDPIQDVASNVNAATGDAWAIFISIFIALICLTIGILCFAKYFKKNPVMQNADHSKINRTISSISNSNKINNTIAIILIILCAGLFISIFNYESAGIKAYAADQNEENVSVPNKIYAKLDTNNNLSIDNLNIKNDNSYNVAFKNFKLSQINGLTDTSTWTIKYNDTILFQNTPGSIQEVTEQIIIKAHQDAVLEISSNMSSDTAIKLNEAIFELEYSIPEAPELTATEPTVVSDLRYNGSEQVGVIGNDTIELTGTTSATDPGTYQAQATPKDGYLWADKTKDTKTYKWNIAKCQPKAELEGNQYFIAIDLSTSKTMAINYLGDGEASLKINDESKVSGSVTNNTLTLEAKSPGITNGTVSFSETEKYLPASFDFSVCVSKNYTGYSQFPLFDDDGIFDVLDSIMTGLQFEWNPYKILNANNTEYNKDLAVLAGAINSDTLEGTHIKLDDVDEWDMFDCETLYKVLGMQDVTRLQVYPDKYTYDKNDTQTAVVSHLNVKANGQEKELVIVTLASTNILARNEVGCDLDVGTANCPESYPLREHPEWKNYTNHKGFDVAYRRISQMVKDYITTHVSPNAEKTMFISGHSKGAAVANLLGAEYENDKASKSFTYGLATPAVTQSDDIDYKTIFNIKNTSDFVPAVPLEQWGFKTLGTTKKADMQNDFFTQDWKDRIKGHPYVAYDIKALEQMVYEVAKTRDDIYKIDPDVPPAFSEKYYYKEDAQYYLNEKISCLKNVKLEKAFKAEGPTLTEDGYWEINIYYTPAFITQLVTNSIEIFKTSKSITDIIDYYLSVIELLTLEITIPQKYTDMLNYFVGNIDTILSGFLCNHSLYAYYMLPAHNVWIE